MDLHVKAMIYVIALWCIHMIPGVVSFYLKRSTDFFIKPVIKVFAELDSSEIPLIENYSMTKTFMRALQGSEGDFSNKFYIYTTMMLLSCIISHVFGMVYFHGTFGLNFSPQKQIPDVYYFYYEYEVVYGSGLVQCYWIASRIMNFGILFFSYAYLFGSLLLVYEILVVYFVTLQGLNELLEFFVENNVGYRQARVIKMVSMGLLDLKYDSNSGNTVEASAPQLQFDQHQVNEEDIRISFGFAEDNLNHSSPDDDNDAENQEFHAGDELRASVKRTKVLNNGGELNEGMSTSSGDISAENIDYHDANKPRDDADNSAVKSSKSNSKDKRKENLNDDDDIDISVRKDIVVEYLKDIASIKEKTSPSDLI
ncbi:MAG: hypothetical protein MHMPM18_003306 [Marteilia pararefringens]